LNLEYIGLFQVKFDAYQKFLYFGTVLYFNLIVIFPREIYILCNGLHTSVSVYLYSICICTPVYTLPSLIFLAPHDVTMGNCTHTLSLNLRLAFTYLYSFLVISGGTYLSLMLQHLIPIDSYLLSRPIFHLALF